MGNPFLNIDKQILADSGTSGDAAKNLHILCDQIGPRFAGTSGYRRAAEFMLGTFNQYKLENTELEAFKFASWQRGEPGELTMKEPFTRSFPCYTLPYSPSTDPCGVEAEILDIGTGSEKEISASCKEIKGRIVMTTAKAGHRTVICGKCAELGAVGFLLASSTEGMLLPTGTVANGEESAIPAAGIAYESATQLRRLIGKRPIVMQLRTDAAIAQDTTWNVLGELTGTEFPDELVIMGGHLDSHDIGPGAFDNAAGAVAVMEAARLLAKHRKHLKRTVRFIGFAAEEIGLLGSHHHAKRHSARLRKARFMLNADCPSMGRPKGLVFHECPKAKAYVDTLALQMETPVAFHSRFHRHSDHYPFILKGLPTAGMSGGPFGPSIQHFVHMSADTADKISLVDLREGAAFAAQILLRAANDENWPNMRRSPAQIKKLEAAH